MRSSSKEGQGDLQFGRGRQTTDAAKDSKAPTTARSSSKDKSDLKFGSSAVRQSSSKEKLGLTFNKHAATVAAAAPLDPSMTTIKKTELEKLQEKAAEFDQLKDEVYELNVKKKQLTNQLDQLKQQHQDQIEDLTNEMNQKHFSKVEDLVKQHSEERNELIRESNKSNDSKFNDLLKQHEDLQKTKTLLEAKHTADLADLRGQYEKDIETMDQLN